MTEYELVRSRRKTLSVQVTRECRVIVRAPLRLAKREIDRFVFEHADWIARALAHQRTLAEAHPEPDEAQARALRSVRCAKYRRRCGTTPRSWGCARPASALPLRGRGSARAAGKQSVLFLAADGVPRGGGRLRRRA